MRVFRGTPLLKDSEKKFTHYPENPSMGYLISWSIFITTNQGGSRSGYLQWFKPPLLQFEGVFYF